MSNPRAAAPLLDCIDAYAQNSLTIIRDATQSIDSIPLLLHLSKIVTSQLKPSERGKQIFLTTRSRTSFAPNDPHPYPSVPRANLSALAGLASFDPYHFKSQLETVDASNLAQHLTDAIRKASVQNKAKFVVIECLHSLKFIFNINPSAFVRGLLTPNDGLSVILACPIESGLDDDIVSLSEIADTIIDLGELQTGVANDVDGLIKLAKIHGRWHQIPNNLPYQVAENSSFNIYT